VLDLSNPDWFSGKTFDVVPRPITITAKNQNKTYGDTKDLYLNPPQFTVSDNLAASELVTDVTLTCTAGVAVTATAGDYPITPSGATGSNGFLASNYNITYSTAGNLTVDTRPISIAVNPSLQTKVYGDADPTPFTYHLTSGTLENDDEFSGPLTRAIGDHVGDYAIGQGSLTIVNGSTNKYANYNVSFTGGTFQITKRPLTLSNFHAPNKIYDRTTDVTGTPAAGFSDDRVLNDDLTFGFTAAFDTPYAGSDKTVNFSAIAITGGSDAGNYDLLTTSGSVTPVTISQKLVTPSVTANNKCYDGNTTASLISQTLTGVISPDVVTLLVTASNFNSAAAGTDKTVTSSGLTLGGADAANYTLNGVTTATTTATIFELPVPTITGKSLVCQYSTETYSTESGMTGYSWNVTGGSISEVSGSSSAIYVTWNSNGSQTVSVNYVDGNGCTAATATVKNVAVSLPISASATATPITCTGSADGFITTSVSGGTPGYYYLWSNNETTSSISGLTAGTYTVTVTDLPGCIQTASATVLESPILLSTNPLPTPITCTGSHDGAVNANISGGTGPFTYEWTGPGDYTDSENPISGLLAGTYYVTVTDAYLCTKTASATVLESTELLAISAAATPITCTGANDGMVSATVTGGTQVYAYSWTGPGGFTSGSKDISSLSAGTYYVTVTDAYLCQKTASATVLESAELLAISAAATPITCTGSHDGYINTTVSGGTLNYSYQWSGPGAYSSTSMDISGLYAGTYYVTVTDAYHCTKTASAEVKESTELLAISAAATPITCTGSHDGYIITTVSGGTLDYSYQWSGPGAYTSTSKDISGLYAGTYYVTVTDAYLCTKTASAIVLESPQLLAISVAATPITCYGSHDGVVTASVTGGTTSYSYAWSGPDGYTSDANPVTGLSAGTYYVTVTDAYLCQKTASAIVLESTELLAVTAAATPITCRGSHDGVVIASVSGGTTAYSYVWSGPDNYTSTANPITGLAAGTYDVTVTDAYLCQKTASATVLESPELLAISAAATPITCTGSHDGYINTTVSGGTLDYSYQWSGPGAYTNTSKDISGLSAGTYYVTVTDAYLCTKTASATVLESAELLAISAAATPITCTGSHDGYINTTVSGGTLGYSFNWSGPDNFTASSQNISSLVAGNYYVTVTDNYLCQKTATATVLESPLLLAISAAATPITCKGSNDGMVTASTSGGTEAYSYSWTGPDSYTGTGNPISGLSAGTYYVTVTDAYHCTKTASAIVLESPQLLAISAAATPITCMGANDGKVSATATGGTEAYTFSWTGPDGFNAGSMDISSLSAGTYYVTVTDAYLCQKTASATVLESTELLAVTAAATPITCTGSHDGVVIASVSGGTTAYSYAWSGPDNYTSAANPITGLAAGTYYVTVTDAYLCQKTASATVLESPELLAISATATPITCFGSNDGMVTASVTGGTAGYTYTWSGPGSYTSDANPITGLSAGTYYVTVTDAYLCQKTASAEVLESQQLLDVDVSATDVTCFGASNGIIATTVTGGTLAYSYQWSGPGGFTSNSKDVSGLTTGTYTVTVTDAYLCKKTATASITEPDLLTVGGSVTSQVWCYGGNDGAIDITVGGGTGSYTYLWSNNATSQDISGLIADDYYVTVTDAHSCTVSGGSWTITQPTELSISPEGVTNVICYGYSTGAISASCSGGVPGYAYLWSNNSTSSMISNLTAGNYTVTITDQHSCTMSHTFTVSQPAIWAVTIGGNANACCGTMPGSYTYTADVTGTFATPLTYQWVVNGGSIVSGGNSSAIVVVWSCCGQGSITLQVNMPPNNCQLNTSKTIEIGVPPVPVITGPSLVVTGETSTYCASANVGPPNTWIVTGGSITSGQGTGCITVLWDQCNACPNGSVTLIQASNGCTGTTMLPVTFLPGAGNLTGYVHYNNAYATGLNGVTITLIDNATGVIAATTISGPNTTNGSNDPGYYSFANLPAGTYHLMAGYAGTWGGNNATDALIVQLNVISLYPLQYLRLVAADVNSSTTISGLDALYIKLRTIGSINSYPGGDWKFTDTTFVFSTPVPALNIKGLCVGDVNGSYIPVGYKESPLLSIAEDGLMTVPVGEPFVYNIRSGRNAELGAMTLFMGYDNDRFEVVDVASKSEGMKYAFGDGKISIAWADTKPLNVKTDDLLLSLNLRVKDQLAEPTDVFTLRPGSEFADMLASPYTNYDLKMSNVVTPGTQGLTMYNYPNPFKNTTTILYTLPEAGHVKLVLTDLYGKTMATLADSRYKAGSHAVTVDPAALHMAPGIYLYKIIFDNSIDTQVKVNKMVFTR
jgi:hypothetical protein